MPKSLEYAVLLIILLFLSDRKLILRIRKQGAETQGISKFVSKMMHRHWDPFQKFDLSAEKIASNVSSIQ